MCERFCTLSFLKRAAQQGHFEAKVRLAFHLAEKRSGADRASEAADWFESAARQGHAVSQLNLALIYANGFICPQDRRLAHMWANISASNGSNKGNELRSRMEKQMNGTVSRS
jgi:TPR repeat protein